jgi:hypothetical protein
MQKKKKKSKYLIFGRTADLCFTSMCFRWTSDIRTPLGQAFWCPYKRESLYKQPRITKNNFGRDLLWGVPISEWSYIGGPYIRLFTVLVSGDEIWPGSRRVWDDVLQEPSHRKHVYSQHCCSGHLLWKWKGEWTDYNFCDRCLPFHWLYYKQRSISNFLPVINKI